MEYYNYKGLPYRESHRQFKKDCGLRYKLYGQFTKWKTKSGLKVQVRHIRKKHLIHIVEKFGNTYIWTNYPFIWYRYLKEVIRDE